MCVRMQAADTEIQCGALVWPDCMADEKFLRREANVCACVRACVRAVPCVPCVLPCCRAAVLPCRAVPCVPCEGFEILLDRARAENAIVGSGPFGFWHGRAGL